MGVAVAIVENMGFGRGRAYGLCNGREERKRGKEALEERERKSGEMKKVGPVMVIN